MIRFIILSLLCREFVTLKFPQSFSVNHVDVSLVNPPVRDIIDQLSKFEVDLHIQIVLVGADFSDTTIRDVSQGLDTFSSMTISGSPSSYMHEKFIYHVSIVRSLEEPLLNAIKSSPVDSTIIDKILSNHHSLGMASTTIFVLQLMRFNSGYQYSYQNIYFDCPQRSFISSSGFAWIDLSAKSFDIGPTFRGSNILRQPKLSNSSQPLDSKKLSYLIHHSSEALNPFPYSSFSHYISINKRPPRTISLLLITICSTPNEKSLCSTDPIALSTAESIIRLYSSSFLQIGYTTVVFSLHESPALAHAVHASTMYTSAIVKERLSVTISSSELHYWLSNCEAIRNAIYHAIGDEQYPDRVLLPILTVTFPSSVSVTFEDNTIVKNIKHTSPVTSLTLTSERIKYDSDHDGGDSRGAIDGRLTMWPTQTILVLRSSAERVNKLGLECGELGDLSPLVADAGKSHLKQMTWHAVRRAIWGLSPPHEYFSIVSQQVITDYQWSSPQLVGSAINEKPSDSIDNKESTIPDHQFSFREKRAVQRLTFVVVADQLLSRFTSLLSLSTSMAPPINVSLVLGEDTSIGEGSYSLPKPAISQPKSAGGRLTDASPHEDTVTPSHGSLGPGEGPRYAMGLLEQFITFMDAAARDVSQLDFDSAMINLNNAESRLLQSDKRIQRMVSMRRGSITCSHSTETASLAEDASTNDSVSSGANWEGYVHVIGVSMTTVMVLFGIVFGAYRGWGSNKAQISASRAKSILFRRAR